MNKRNLPPSDQDTKNWEKIPFRIIHVSSKKKKYI